MPVLAAVEGGGTTYVVAIARDKPENIIERASFPTTTPEETLSKCKDWLKQRSFDALGIATFGPVDPRTSSKTYGHITKTPKKLWRDADVVGALDIFGVPVKFDTDVNAPALSEYRAMVLKGEDPSCVAYATVGTGVGVGLVVNGAPVHGLLHPEAGHACVPRYPNDTFEGHNPSLNCPGWAEVEAMCASGALAKRAGLSDTSGLKDLPDDHEVWDVAAHYLAALCANLILVVSPEKIVLSGGVMLRKSLFPKIRAKTVQYLNGYIPVPAVASSKAAETLIVPSPHGNNAGIIGALTLAQDALSTSSSPCRLSLMGGAFAAGALLAALLR